MREVRAGYDAAFPVSASWALEFAPVNLSVLFMQRDGNEHRCIGSRSWFFAELADCIAEAREVFPWRVSRHLIPPDEKGVWRQMFERLELFNAWNVPAFPDNQRMLLTQQFLSRLTIDTASRPWEPDGNNSTLIDSLNGYKVKELASHSDAFTMNILGTHEQYLTRALEHYAAWDWRRPASTWGPKVDYSKDDKRLVKAWRR